MENPLDSVFIVGGSKDVLNDQLSCSCHDDRLVSEVRVLEEDAIIFLVNADGILDRSHSASLRREVGIQIMDRAFTVAAECEAVSHIATTILAQIKGVFSVVRALWLSTEDTLACRMHCDLYRFHSLRHHHLRKGQPVEGCPHSALVIVCDVVQYNALPIVEANVEFP